MNIKTIIKGTFSLAVLLSVVLVSCKKDVVDPGPPPAPSPNSKLTLNFKHSVNGVQIERDSVMFTNLAGNQFGISSVRYLISDIRLDDFDGNFREIDQYQLIDFADQNTWEFVVKDSIKKGSIKSVSFYMGFLPEENVTNGDYPDLDAANWAFPPLINGIQAGGYYAFQMSGSYIPIGDTVKVPYNIEIGSKKLVNNGSVTSYQPNPIIGSFAQSDFVLVSTKVEMDIRFNLAKVFDYNGGNILNLDIYDMSFPEDQNATEIVSTNLTNAFSAGDIRQGEEIE